MVLSGRSGGQVFGRCRCQSTASHWQFGCTSDRPPGGSSLKKRQKQLSSLRFLSGVLGALWSLGMKITGMIEQKQILCLHNIISTISLVIDSIIERKVQIRARDCRAPYFPEIFLGLFWHPMGFLWPFSGVSLAIFHRLAYFCSFFFPLHLVFSIYASKYSDVRFLESKTSVCTCNPRLSQN